MAMTGWVSTLSSAPAKPEVAALGLAAWFELAAADAVESLVES